MHPSLQLHLHSDECQRVIKALLACHQAHPARRYVGACNQLKLALNRCLQDEYVRRRSANQDQAQERRARARQLLDHRESDGACTCDGRGTPGK